MYKKVEKLWLSGTDGQSRRLRRQIALGNQIGLFGAAATVPYQLFYLLYDIGLYLPVFVLNLVFMAAYLAVLLVDRMGRYTWARNLVLTNACTQIFAVTYFIGADAAVHLFYFTIASVLALIFFRRRNVALLMMLSLVAVLFLACHFAFETGATPVPAGWVDLMFMVSVVSSLALTGGFSFLFRMEIDHAEDQLIEINLNLEKLSTTDQLTSLPNRRSLDHFLEREWARMAREKRPLSILMCDVDYFKAYNDHYGHQAGDECLRRIAIALEEEVGRPPDLVARYGGEEFAVILPHTNEAGARYLGERVRLAIERLGITHACSEVSGVITLSVGASTFMPDSDVLAQQLLARADEALYEAKSGGRNHVVFQPLG